MFKMVFSQIFIPCRETMTRIRKADKDFIKELGCQDIKFPDKIRDTHKIGKKKIVSALVVLVINVKNSNLRFKKYFYEAS